MPEHNIRISRIEQVSDATKTFVDKVKASPAEEIGQILAETIGFYRLKNEVKIIQNDDPF